MGEAYPRWTTGFYERRVPKLFGITKAIRIDSGDGWKDTGRKGDHAFAYAREMPAPYAAGSFMHVGNPIMASGAQECRFEQPAVADILRLLPLIVRDLRFNRSRLRLMFGPIRSYRSQARP